MAELQFLKRLQLSEDTGISFPGTISFTLSASVGKIRGEDDPKDYQYLTSGCN